MKFVERNGLRILIADFGCLIHNIKTDMYAEKFYLGVHATLDDFEEVENESIDKNLRIKMKELDEKEKECVEKIDKLNKIGKIVANQVVDDVVALSIKEFYDEWGEGVAYKINQYVMYKEILYKVLIEHNSQVNWTPDVSPSLFAKVLADPTGENINEWVQPDSTNGYMKGDKVKFEGNVYESVIDNNIWSPVAYPDGWKLVE